MRELLLLLVLCVLPGCSLWPSRAPQKTDFDFGPEANASSDPSPPLSQAQVVVYDIGAPAWMDGTTMYYRLAYQNAAIPLPYAQSEWVMSPPALLTERLRSSIAVYGNGGNRRSSEDAPVPYALRAELVEFEQIFDAPDRSRGVLRLRATLEGPGVWAQRTFAVERPAPTLNAAGGVTALTECSDEVVGLLAEWVLATRTAAHPGSRTDLKVSRSPRPAE
jgi:cholesterol transport system auxiliary component